MALNIKIGNRVEITNTGSEKSVKNYVSVVENVFENGHILMPVPVSYGRLVTLVLKKKYIMTFFTEKGMLRYEARILKYINDDNYNYMLAELCDDGSRIQRREFFRFNCVLPFKYLKLEDMDVENEIIEDLNLVLSKGIIKDLGGGGLRFLANEELKVGDKIKCLVFLRNEHFIAISDIIHMQHYPKSNYKYQYRVKFTNIQEKDKDIIIKYIFDEQRRLATLD